METAQKRICGQIDSCIMSKNCSPIFLYHLQTAGLSGLPHTSSDCSACVCIVDTDNYVIAKHTPSRDVNFIPGDVIHGVALVTAR